MNNLKAFTLAEVIIAVVILSSSLVVLMGLQSSAVSKALRDRQQLQAMLVGKQIMAGIEIQEITETRENDSVYQLLQKFNVLPKADPELEEQYNQMNAELVIAEWQNPEEFTSLTNSDQNLLYRVYLRIYWGETPDDQLELVYFVPIANEN